MSAGSDPDLIPFRDPDRVIDRTVDGAYRVERFAGSDNVTASDVIDLWVSEGVVAYEVAVRRIDEVLLVASHPEGGLVGVSTAYLRRNDQLGLEFWYFRVFTAAQHRNGNLMRVLSGDSFDLLTDRHTSGRDTRSAGIIGEAENRGLRQYYPEAEVGYDLRYIGTNLRGDQVRVRWFPGVRVPLVTRMRPTQ